MMDWLQNVVEYREWGFNSATVGVFGIIIFAFVESWALWKQGRIVWRMRSGKSISFVRVGYSMFFTASSVAYGFHISSISMVLNRFAVVLFNIPIVAGLIKFKEISFWEKMQVGLFILMVPAMIVLPHKDLLYIAFSSGTLYVLGTQVWELYKTKATGALDIRLIIVYIISTLFWMAFAYSVGALGLKVLTTGGIVMLSAIAGLWLLYWFRERKS